MSTCALCCCDVSRKKGIIVSCSKSKVPANRNNKHQQQEHMHITSHHITCRLIPSNERNAYRNTARGSMARSYSYYYDNAYIYMYIYIRLVWRHHRSEDAPWQSPPVSMSFSASYHALKSNSLRPLTEIDGEIHIYTYTGHERGRILFGLKQSRRRSQASLSNMGSLEEARSCIRRRR